MTIDPARLSDEQLEEVLLGGATALAPKVGEGRTYHCADTRFARMAGARDQAMDQLLVCARELLLRQALKKCQSSSGIDSPQAAREYLKLYFSGREAEAFVVVFLDTHHRVLGVEEMFRGTLTQTSVYPREIVKRALWHNAGAVLLAHNHPSGLAEPSRADEMLTQTLKASLSLVDVRVIDHVVVAGASCVSFAERGLL